MITNYLRTRRFNQQLIEQRFGIEFRKSTILDVALYTFQIRCKRDGRAKLCFREQFIFIKLLVILILRWYHIFGTPCKT